MQSRPVESTAKEHIVFLFNSNSHSQNALRPCMYSANYKTHVTRREYVFVIVFIDDVWRWRSDLNFSDGRLVHFHIVIDGRQFLELLL